MQQPSLSTAAPSPYSQASAQYLDTVTAQTDAQRYKQQSYDLLGAREGDSLLDAGCGTGDDVRALARLVGPTGRVTGIDFREDVIAEARQRANAAGIPAVFEVGDIYQLPFPDARFDGCRADRVFQHLTNPGQALTELCRVTRSGGRIVVSDPDWDTLIVASPDVATTRAVTRLNSDTWHHGQMGRQLYGLFRAAGLEEVTILPITLFFTDFALASELYHLRRTAERAVQQGLLTPEAVAGWLASLEQADRAGQFFSAATGFTVCGRKP